MDKHDILELHRARTLAGWSYIGILIPLLGWILGGMSLSALKKLDPKTGKAVQRVQDVRNLAKGGVITTTVVFVLGTAIGGYIGHRMQQNAELERINQTRMEREARQAAEAAANLAAFERENQERLLQECLSNVDKWSVESYKSISTIYQEQNFLQLRQQELDKCNLLYSTN